MNPSGESASIIFKKKKKLKDRKVRYSLLNTSKMKALF